MKPMFLSLALLAAVSAAAQTSPHAAPHRVATSHHHTATTAAASKIPRVPGIPKTLYRLRYIDIVIGKGPLAEPDKWYTVRYIGWLTDGTKFDSSYDHPGGAPITFPYGAKRVIIGWDTGFEGMHVGGKRRLYVPYQLAYGELGRPPVIPAKADLVFDVELVSMSDTPPGEPAPEPAQAPAQETKPAAPTAPATQPQTSPHPEGL
jgi:FKBP-type peptidyl-prolyl cis-trans isomerases 1